MKLKKSYNKILWGTILRLKALCNKIFYKGVV